MANEQSISIRQGESGTYVVTYNVSGAALDITNYSVVFTVKKRIEMPDSAATLQKTLTLTDATHGQATLILLPTDTQKETGDYFFDFKLKSNSGVTAKIGPFGTFKILDAVTRS